MSDPWAGQPGTRAPHAWLTDGADKQSTLDLLQREWVVLSRDARWLAAAAEVAALMGIALRGVLLDAPLCSDPAAIAETLGLHTDGASLVRPDGYIAWRADALGVAPVATLEDALRRVSSATR